MEIDRCSKGGRAVASSLFAILLGRRLGLKERQVSYHPPSGPNLAKSRPFGLFLAYTRLVPNRNKTNAPSPFPLPSFIPSSSFLLPYHQQLLTPQAYTSSCSSLPSPLVLLPARLVLRLDPGTSGLDSRKALSNGLPRVEIRGTDAVRREGVGFEVERGEEVG